MKRRRIACERSDHRKYPKRASYRSHKFILFPLLAILVSFKIMSNKEKPSKTAIRKQKMISKINNVRMDGYDIGNEFLGTSGN